MFYCKVTHNRMSSIKKSNYFNLIGTTFGVYVKFVKLCTNCELYILRMTLPCRAAAIAQSV